MPPSERPGPIEEQLAAGEARLRSLIDKARDLILVSDPGGILTFVSPSVERQLGYAHDELIGRSVLDFVPEDDHARLTAAMRDLRSHPGRTISYDGPVLHKDGSVHFVEGSAANLLDDPAVRGVVVNARDVTEERASEASRRRSETTLRAIVQHSPLAIGVVDDRGRVQLWNRACEQLFGWEADEVVGRLLPIVPPEEQAVFETVLGRLFAGETIEDVEFPRRLRKDGTRVDIGLSAAPMRAADGHVVAAIGIVADISGRKEAERALRASEERFRSLVHHSTDMIVVLDAGIRVLYASPSAADFFGSTAEELVGRRCPRVGHPDDMPGIDATFAELRAEPEGVRRLEYRQQRADGVWRHVVAIATNLLDNPSVGGLVMNIRDVTGRVEAEEALRERERLMRVLVESASDIITILETDGTIRYSSPVSTRMLGYREGEGYGDPVFQIIHRDDLDRVQRVWGENQGQPGLVPPVEVRLRRADGSWLDTEVIANNLFDNPDVHGIVMTTRDVSERKASEQALRRSEERYRGIVEDQTELVCRYLPDSTITFVNRAFAEFYGATPGEMVGTSLLDLFPPAERADEQARLASFGPEKTVELSEDWETAADGSLHWFDWTDRAFLDDDGQVVEFQSVGRDMTEQRHATLLTAHQAEILELVARSVPLSETLDAVARAVEEHSPGLRCSILLLEEDGLTLRHGAAPSLPDDFVRALDGIPAGPEGGSCGMAAYRGEPVVIDDVASDPLCSAYRDLALGHGVRACWSTPLLALHTGEVLGSFAVYAPKPGFPAPEHQRVVDLLSRLAAIAVERKQYEETLAHQSLHDPLTELPNRTLFLDRLGLALARGHRTHTEVGVLFLDLDRFKVVNDSLGHDAGDELLAAVARRLEGVVRPGDTVARFGGDEFTVLCEDLPAEEARAQAAEIAQRLLAAISTPFTLHGADTFLSASVGIALGADPGARPEALLRDADAAMYHAKETGKGHVEVFDDAMRERALARHSTENALHRALEREELRLFFQPIVSLEDGHCVGAEALLRWQHPERGLVSPADFIPLAEETGLIIEMGAWVLYEATREAARWQLESAVPFVVAVNLSGRQLAQPDLADRIADAIGRSGVHPENLSLEITESVLMDDTRSTMRAVEAVKALGVGLAIDDFGTGYSSLGYLKRFPVDAVKVDRSFVDGLGTDPGDTAIVSAVVGLAHALGLRVVAEGVETAGQLAELVALGCDEAQGFFFAPPQPAHDVHRLLGRRRRWRPPGARLMAARAGGPGRLRGRA